MSARKAGMVTAGLVAAAVAFPAIALGAPDVTLKASKEKSGPYVNAPGAEPLDVSTTGEEPKNLFVKASLVDDGSAKVRLLERLGSSPGSDDYQFRWFKGRTDISHDVQTSGHLLQLQHGQPKRFRVRVTPKIPDPDDACLFPAITPKGSTLTELAEAFFAINDPGACQ